jgi:hypothetical protein
MAMTKKKLETIEGVVTKILKDNEASRSSNDLLYWLVCKHYCGDISNMDVETFLKGRSQTKCPCFESVTRARRKVLETHPELEPEGTTQARAEEEQVYRDYALNS